MEGKGGFLVIRIMFVYLCRTTKDGTVLDCGSQEPGISRTQSFV
jgi:hypothetical protein